VQAINNTNARQPNLGSLSRTALKLSASNSTATGVIICGLLITLCNNWMSFSFHAYQAELYPTRIRAQAVGFVYSWSRFSAIFSRFIIAFLLGHYGTIAYSVSSPAPWRWCASSSAVSDRR
jgi:MFS family permease